MEKIFTTKVKLPEILLENKRVGKNKILQIGHKGGVLEVEVFQMQADLFLLKKSEKQQFHLKLGKSKIENPKTNTLFAKSLKNIRKLNEKTKLEWLFHGSNISDNTPEGVIDSWSRSFSFSEETDSSSGLRKPQLGAIHAIASHWSVKKDCATIVMPTGTGKTETMISALVYEKCSKVLILVPSHALRRQTVDKFSTLGCLREIGVIEACVSNPRVAVIEHGIKGIDDVNKIIADSNVIVATLNAVNHFSEEVKQRLASECTHLFIDEAHHIPAKTWSGMKEMFKERCILQFTATPFRRDGQKIDGTIIYNYPLGMAQDEQYFKKINLFEVQEFDDTKVDQKIAAKAIEVLEKDLSGVEPKKHILMARCNTKKRADRVMKIYERLGQKYNPILVTSDLSARKYKDAIKKLKNLETRIIVCVDMLGEGFDLPNLKIAALHDIHKSLAITLQFIGRFTRTSKDKDIGEASAIVDISDPKVNEELEGLYSQGADWNKILKEKSESTVQEEMDFHSFINGFSGELSKHISLWNLRPAFSTVIYSTDCKSWNPQRFSEVIPKKVKFVHALNENESILVILFSKEEEVNWGKYKNIKNHTFDLCVAHWSERHRALFLQSSDYEIIPFIQLAKVLCGETTKIKNGQKVFNIFSSIDRPLVRNLGVSTIGQNISYTMHFGDDVTAGLSKLEKSNGVLNNVFGWGYEGGERVAEGCSAKKGKIWARGGGPITIWKEWCHKIADKVFDDNVQESQIIQDFLRPESLEKRYEKMPLLVQWSENILSASEESVSIFFDNKEYNLFEVDLEIVNPSETGPIFFVVKSEDQESKYKIEFTKTKCVYSLISGKEVKIKRYTREPASLVEYVETDPITIIYTDGSFSYNNMYVPTPELNSFFDKEKLQKLDWSNTDIQIESIGKQNRRNSIQYKIAQQIKDDYDIIFNDDASGEAADIIALRQEADNSFRMHLIHCKFSSAEKPGARIDDFYAVCGQAQKSIRWKHNGMEYLVDHMKKREVAWNKDKKTRFIKGTLGGLAVLKKFSRQATKMIFEVSIVQPGLDGKVISQDIIQLLGNTEDYLLKTSGAKFNVFCS